MVEEFADGPWMDKWIEHDNGEIEEFCGRRSTITGQATSKEHVKLTTTDVAVIDDYILQFSIRVGCTKEKGDGSTEAEDISPVHLQYSTDLGMTWHHLIPACLPFFPHCNGKASQASVYYAHDSWRRETIPLGDHVKSR